MKTKERKCTPNAKRRVKHGYTITVLLSVLLLAPTGTKAQMWRWPMAGHKAGENILSQPNSYIDKEFNCCDLFIGGEEGDVVLSPVDGKIIYVSINYHSSLDYVIGGRCDPYMTWDENIAQFVKSNSNCDPQYVSGELSICLANGQKVHLSGLNGKMRLIEGQKISAGDTIGRLAWAYKGLHKPSLNVSSSTHLDVSSDPLSPFGLKSNFHLDMEEREDPVSVEKVRDDLIVLEKAVLELYPSLNERMSNEAFHDSMEALRQWVREPVPQMDMEPLARFLHLLHDSHIARLPDRFNKKEFDFYVPVLHYLFCDDTLRVLGAGKGYEKYQGKAITSIDGISGRDYAALARKYVSLYDHNVESVMEEMVFLSPYAHFMNRGATKESKSHVVFTDGEEAEIPFTHYPVRFDYTTFPYHNIVKWGTTNLQRHPDSIYTTRQLNDSTAYLGIKTFDISKTKLDQLLLWIGENKSTNMIIDMRNNYGGDPEILNKLLACFAQQPMNRQKGSHLYVKKQGNFETLRYSDNHNREEILFPDYIQVEGKDGYYSYDSTKTSYCIMPDSNHQYTGRVYVLTNSKSISCATLFPSVLVRNRRGVSVGRETGSAYHYITALETAQIVLPNIQRTIAIPMVKIVFDTTVCDRTPWGRGLLPDYELPLTYKELTMGEDGETDLMLEYALQLIADGKYLSAEDPFAEADAPQKASRWWIWALSAICIAAIGFSFIKFYHKGRHKKE